MSAIHTSAGAVAGAEAQKVTNVKVAVRCRPLNAEEKRTNQPMVVSCDSDKTVSVSYGNPLRKVEVDTKNYIIYDH